ncbi:MAG: DUF1847 domain-containing protein [Spirochaetes bacterium]|nr:DUF1847 domain-containing protein [Spirochaetota bacterium]
MEKFISPQCAMCAVKERLCENENGKGPAFCPTANYKAVIEKAMHEYERPEIREFARNASIQEGECYSNRGVQPYVMHPVKPRIQEVCEFAHKMNYKKLGIAFCGGLHSEGRTVSEILKAQGFTVVSVMCKCGRVPKETIGLSDSEKIRIGQFEPMCNPIIQAEILNEEKTDFNVLVGLCVGHDSLFFKYSKAFATVLIAKDRVLAHNPAAALYASGTYYSRVFRKGF